MRRSQGEIFGIALMFVIIIVGILIYSQVRALDPDRDTDDLQEEEFKILAQNSLESILKRSTGCFVERDRDRVRDLVDVCLERAFSGTDPEVECQGGDTNFACETALNFIEDSASSLFNSDLVGPIPYVIKVDVPKNSESLLFEKSYSNFGSFTLREEVVTEDNYRDFGYKRAPSGLKSWATAQNAVEFELYLYYR